MNKENSTISSVKSWIFPGLLYVTAMVIWSDVIEVKKDVKSLMAQSNIDKTRIDNIERQIYKASTSFPASMPVIPMMFNSLAILPNNKLIVTNEKVLF